MFKIAICDDEPLFARDMYDKVVSILQKNNIQPQVDMYTSYVSLQHALLEEQKKYHLLLLDILTEGISGIDFAKILRDKDNHTPIIFATSTSDFLIEGYDVEALHYLLKPVSEAKLSDILLKYYQRVVKKKYLTIDDGAGFRQIDLTHICYIETKGRKVALCSGKKEIVIRAKLTEVEKKLESSAFIRCHQSFIVNLHKIEEIKSRKIVLFSGKEIQISRPYFAAVQNAFLAQLD